MPVSFSRRKADRVRVRRRGRSKPWRKPVSKFYNPYNFIPLGKPLTGMLGQRKAGCGHDRYGKDLWSGRIEIEIETATPLLMPDAARAEEKPTRPQSLFHTKRPGRKTASACNKPERRGSRGV